MTNANTMMRVRTSTKDRLRTIATRKRWSLVEAVDAAAEQLEKSETPTPVPAAKRGRRKPSVAVG